MNETKEFILHTTLKLFLQKSFKEVTMKEIVEKTGLSKGAFYHYFPSKEKLFEEIIDRFFSSLTFSKYNDKIPNNSLFDFYNGCIDEMGDMSQYFSLDDTKTNENYFNINFFGLIFDALKLFPSFRDKMEDYHRKEQEIWVSVVKKARKNKEIKSIMSDEQLAMVFNFTSDGLAMNLTLKGNFENLKSEIIVLWDKLYESIKV